MVLSSLVFLIAAGRQIHESDKLLKLHEFLAAEHVCLAALDWAKALVLWPCNSEWDTSLFLMTVFGIIKDTAEGRIGDPEIRRLAQNFKFRYSSRNSVISAHNRGTIPGLDADVLTFWGDREVFVVLVISFI